jgi:tetratricopeptide (TPR) repeat protein
LVPITPVAEISAPVKVAEKPSVKPSPQANNKTSNQANNYIPKKNAPQVAKPYKQNNPALEIQHKPEPDSIDPILTSAYQAYQKGDYETSGKLYREALSKDSKNRDALLGLAAIAQQQGQDDAALQYYRRVLTLDPNDPVAQAALTSFGPGDPAGKESHLKQLIARQPDSAALNFALANQYADQSRWAEAQQAYFNALSLEPSNALYAFNLAISLDHLGQRNVAAQYYRQALQFDTSGNSGFNRDQAQQRLNQIGVH